MNADVSADKVHCHKPNKGVAATCLEQVGNLGNTGGNTEQNEDNRHKELVLILGHILHKDVEKGRKEEQSEESCVIPVEVSKDGEEHISVSVFVNIRGGNVAKGNSHGNEDEHYLKPEVQYTGDFEFAFAGNITRSKGKAVYRAVAHNLEKPENSAFVFACVTAEDGSAAKCMQHNYHKGRNDSQHFYSQVTWGSFKLGRG